MFAVKPGARPSNDPRVEHMRRIVTQVLSSLGYETVVTSGEESETSHMAKSLHYAGLAEDYRSQHIKRGDLDGIVKTIQARLGADYDFILEYRNLPNEHFHGEFDPD